MEVQQSSQKGLIGAIIFAALVVSGSLGFLGFQMMGSSANGAGASERTELMAALQDLPANELQSLFDDLSKRVQAPYDLLVDDDPVMGNPDAEVTLIEFSDYQCPFCQRHYSQTMPLLLSQYIDTGKVKYVYRDFPLSFHADAKRAANAAECAREQGGDEMYFEMNRDIFGNDNGSLTLAKLSGYAKDLSLDVSAFESCVTSGTYDAEIEADIASGGSFGINGTPGFVITNGEEAVRISGAQPFANFQQEIDALLN